MKEVPWKQQMCSFNLYIFMQRAFYARQTINTFYFPLFYILLFEYSTATTICVHYSITVCLLICLSFRQTERASPPPGTESIVYVIYIMFISAIVIFTTGIQICRDHFRL